MRRTCSRCGDEFEAKYANYCERCRWRYRRKRAKYVWTLAKDEIMRREYDPKIRGRAQDIADKFGWPKWVIKKRAARLGLAHSEDRRAWTEEEERFLLFNAGHRHINWMAKELGRTETSVVVKLKRMKISRAMREGYTLRELELCFGMDHRVIERWAREGKLRVRKRDYETGAHRSRPWAVTDAALLEFVRDYPLEFRLDKVDQVWFMDLITNGGLIANALRDEMALEEAA